MNKRVSAIVAGSAVVLALCGALVALNSSKPMDSDGDSSSSDSIAGTMLWHHESNEIASVNITYEGDSFKVLREDETETDENGNEITNYHIEGMEKLPMNTTLVRSIASRFATLTSEKTVEEHPDNLEQYGLDDPISKATAVLDDGTELSLSIGDITPLGSQRYILVDDTVYTASSYNISPITTAKVDFLTLDITAEKPEGDTTRIEKLSVHRKNMEKDLVLEYDHFYAELESGGTSASHVLSSPIVCNVNVEKADPILQGLYGLTAKKALTPFPTEADLKEAGLDDPFCTVDMRLSDGTTRLLKLGNTIKDEETGDISYYGYFDGIDIIYSFDAATAVWATVTPTDIAAKMVFVTYVWDIGKLTVEAPGKRTMTFEGKGKNQDDYVCTLNGREIDSERYRKFYVFLLKTAGEDLCLNGEEPTGKKIAGITLERQDGLKAQTVEFYEAEGLQCYIVVDGVCTFKCRKSYVDTLLKNMDLFDSEEDFILSW